MSYQYDWKWMNEFMETAVYSLFPAVVSDHLLAIAIRQASTENVQSGREVSDVLCVFIQFSHRSIYWAFKQPNTAGN